MWAAKQPKEYGTPTKHFFAGSRYIANGIGAGSCNCYRTPEPGQIRTRKVCMMIRRSKKKFDFFT